MKKLLSVLLISGLVYSCKTPKETAESKPEKETTETVTTIPVNADSLVASIERTACYGQCPMYKFSVFNSGYTTYEGKRFVDNIGKFDSRVEEGVVRQIREKATAVNYFSFKDEYPKKASDFPAVKTSVVLDGKRKDIMDGSGAPLVLKEFEAYLDSIKDAVEWKEMK